MFLLRSTNKALMDSDIRFKISNTGEFSAKPIHIENDGQKWIIVETSTQRRLFTIYPETVTKRKANSDIWQNATLIEVRTRNSIHTFIEV